MARLLKIGTLLALACAAAVYPAVWIVGATAVDVYMISAKDPTMVEMGKAIFAPSTADKASPAYRREVMDIYGAPTEQTTRVVFVPKSRLVVPPELPSITLLPLDFKKESSPFQLQSFYFFAPYVLVGALASHLLLLLLWRFKARSKPAPPAA